MKINRFDFKGYRVQFPLGLRNKRFALTLTQDDGTWGNYLIVECDDIPYAAIPVIDKEGLGKIIRVLKEIHKQGFNNA